MNLFNTVILVTAAAAVVLLVKLAFGNRITPRGHMLMWILVAVSVLAAPLAEILPESDFSAKTYLPQSRNTTETVWVEPYENLDARGFGIEEQGNYYTVQKDHVSMQVPFTGKTVGSDFTATVSRAKIENYVWIAGAAAVLLLMLAGTMKQKRRLKVLPCMDDANARAELDELKKLVGIRDVAKIQIRSGADSTFLTVMGGQYLIALEDGYTQEERRRVLAHELTHLAHGDLIYNLISAFFLAAFWWNPVIWLAFRRFRRDMEVYCDYDAARKTGDKKGYAETLVRAAAGTERFILGTTSFIGGEKEVSARVKALAAFKKPKTWIAVIAVLALIAACASLITNPRTDAGLCQKYFSSLKADDVVYMYLYQKETENIGIGEKEEIQKLLDLFGTLEKEDFAETADSADGEYTDTLALRLKNGEKLELRGDMGEGRGLYYIAKYTEESYEENGINGHWLTCPQMGSLLQEYYQTNLHMDLGASGGLMEEVYLHIRNTGRSEYNETLRYDDKYRVEQYMGNTEISSGDGHARILYEDDASNWEMLEPIEPQDKEDEQNQYELKAGEWTGQYISLRRDYGMLPTGIYRITKTFTQELASGAITKECSTIFQGEAYALSKEEWTELLAAPDGELSDEVVVNLDNKFHGYCPYDGFGGLNYNTNTMYCFFSSKYSSPEKLDFKKFLQYYPQFDAFLEWTPELKKKFEASEFWREYREQGITVDTSPAPVRLYKPEIINEGLEYYTGIGLDEIKANNTQEYWDSIYVKEIDRFVNFTSDAGGWTFEPERGTKKDGIVKLYGAPRKDGSRNVLTLKEKDGRYLIQSFVKE